jgi:hypothetical protein
LAAADSDKPGWEATKDASRFATASSNLTGVGDRFVNDYIVVGDDWLANDDGLRPGEARPISDGIPAQYGVTQSTADQRRGRTGRLFTVKPGRLTAGWPI